MHHSRATNTKPVSTKRVRQDAPIPYVPTIVPRKDPEAVEAVLARIEKEFQDPIDPRPWPSEAARTETIDEAVRMAIADDKRMKVARIRGLVRMQADRGPAVVMTHDECEAAYERARKTPAEKKPQSRDLDQAEVRHLLSTAVIDDLHLSEYIERIGKIVYVESAKPDENVTHWVVVRDQDDILFLVLPMQPAGVRVVRIGIMVAGHAYPSRTLIGDPLDTIPAFDDTVTIAHADSAGAA